MPFHLYQKEIFDGRTKYKKAEDVPLAGRNNAIAKLWV
jgi:hypothetical protein